MTVKAKGPASGNLPSSWEPRDHHHTQDSITGWPAGGWTPHAADKSLQLRPLLQGMWLKPLQTAEPQLCCHVTVTSCDWRGPPPHTHTRKSGEKKCLVF